MYLCVCSWVQAQGLWFPELPGHWEVHTPLAGQPSVYDSEACCFPVLARALHPCSLPGRSDWEGHHECSGERELARPGTGPSGTKSCSNKGEPQKVSLNVSAESLLAVIFPNLLFAGEENEAKQVKKHPAPVLISRACSQSQSNDLLQLWAQQLGPHFTRSHSSADILQSVRPKDNVLKITDRS